MYNPTEHGLPGGQRGALRQALLVEEEEVGAARHDGARAAAHAAAWLQGLSVLLVKKNTLIFKKHIKKT